MALAGLTLVGWTQTTEWTFDPAHTKIRFVVTHMVISEVEGLFHSFEGKVMSDKDDFSDAKVEFKIDASSIDTDNDRRNGHLKSPDFFDVKKYPSLEFKSTKLEPAGSRTYKLYGDLTMHGTTKPVVLDLKYNGSITDGRGNKHAGFKAITTINRMDWGLKWNHLLETGGAIVSSEVNIICNVELVQVKSS